MEVEREKEQELEWVQAQKIEITVDLLAAAKQHLQFLAAVDKNRWLYEGPALEKAIYRYNACWLPLLAKHSELPVSEGPLVVPLDCEWIWHCHRLNPIRYKSDCEELYGKILDFSNVVSSIKGVCKRQTEDIWNRLYPNEIYEFESMNAFSEVVTDKLSTLDKFTKYDLVSAVRRQSPFFYQVSRPHMKNEVFLEEAVARYKGFLHIIKRNREKNIKCFCVPTYDIDLIWHTHQLHPVSYCKDVSQALGRVLTHDDMDSDRTKGKKLDVGFSETTRHWEETFGQRYAKAGAMYRGSSPSPVTVVPFQSDHITKVLKESNDMHKMIEPLETKVVEVLLEIVGVKNLPEGHSGSLAVIFSKKQPDLFFNCKWKLTILSESGEKQVANFQCEPKGELFFELVSYSPSKLPLTKTSKTMGTVSFSLGDFLNPVSKLAVEKWVELLPSPGNRGMKPISLRIALSSTIPVQAPQELHMIHSRPEPKLSCFFPLSGREQQAKKWTRVFDKTEAEILSLQIRDSTKSEEKDRTIRKQQVIGVSKSGETCTLAQFVGTESCLMDQWCLKRREKSNADGHLFVLKGSRMVKIYQGRKLDFEPKHWEKQRSEQDFMTAVEFSAEDPYGKAVALLDLKSGYVKVKEAWLMLPAIVSAFILSYILKKEGYEAFSNDRENLMEMDGFVGKVNSFHEEPKQTSQNDSAESNMELNVVMAKGSLVKSGGCGSDCGGGCGNMMSTECGGGCGDMVKSGGCGGGCGSGCEDMVSGGCGGCGSGCGNMVKRGDYGGGCGSGCGGGCGSGCGGGCGGHMPGKMPKSGGCGADSGCKITHESSVVKSCTDDCPDKSPIHTSEAVVA